MGRSTLKRYKLQIEYEDGAREEFEFNELLDAVECGQEIMTYGLCRQVSIGDPQEIVLEWRHTDDTV